MNLDSWHPIATDIIKYEQSIDHEAYFNKLISIWRNQNQSANARIASSKLISDKDEEYKNVISHVPHSILNLIQKRQNPFEIRKLIPKDVKSSWYCYEISFEDSTGPDDELTALFFPVRLDDDTSKIHPQVPYAYAIGFKILDETSGLLVLGVPDNVQDVAWLKNNVFPTLSRWVKKMDPEKEIIKTNRQINVESYQRRYVKMKIDYGVDIVKQWHERTNPYKYVYEDCGIASYLLETWSRIDSTPKFFADVGCGNGLLVHLLNKEGVAGAGFDIRARKIWTNILQGTDLREFTIDPTINPPCLPAECDYLIGNHSDELTPWIPVMAARKRCEFFLLPCCAYDFHGKYHARPGKLGSTYAGFLEFVRFVCRRLGFIIEEDRLSIPSSKRLCIIGRIPPDGLPSAEKIEEIISDVTASIGKKQSAPSFVPRPKIQPVRNCVNIPRDIANNITKRVFNALLEADPTSNIDGWRTGGAVPIGEMIKILSPEEKAFMKQQDGGFQTFLKNSNQAFHIYEGKIHIRNLRIMKKRVPTHSFSKCWMLNNHPDGCPYGPGCIYVHK